MTRAGPTAHASPATAISAPRCGAERLRWASWLWVPQMLLLLLLRLFAVVSVASSFAGALLLRAPTGRRSGAGGWGAGQRLLHRPLVQGAGAVQRLAQIIRAPLWAVPDLNDDDFDTFAHLKQEFGLLSRQGKKQKGAGAVVSYESFMEWEEIQALLSDGLCSNAELQEIWSSLARGADAIDFDTFVEINRVLDDKFPYEIDEEDEGENGGGGGGKMSDVEGELLDYDDIDPWSAEFDPKEALEPEFVLHLEQFYNAHARKSPPFGLSYDVFASWDEIKRMLAEGEVDSACLKELWAEAVTETAKAFPDKMKQMGKNIDLDTFLRLNIRLDMILDELQEALESLSDEQVEEYYRKEFDQMATKGGGGVGGGGGEKPALLSYKALMDWADMREMLQSGMLVQEEVDAKWDALPRQPLPSAAGGASGGGSKGFGSSSGKSSRQSEGITLEAFLALNTAIEDEERSEVMGGELQ